MGADVLASIVHRDVAHLLKTLRGITGPVSDLEMLGMLQINEKNPTAAALLLQGFDLLRENVLKREPCDYQIEVMGVVTAVALAGIEDKLGQYLIPWLDALLHERPTQLIVSDAMLTDREEDEIRAMHAVIQRMEALDLDRALPATLASTPTPLRPRL